MNAKHTFYIIQMKSDWSHIIRLCLVDDTAITKRWCLFRTSMFHFCALYHRIPIKQMSG